MTLTIPKAVVLASIALLCVPTIGTLQDSNSKLSGLLIDAVKAKSLEQVNRALAQGADPNAREKLLSKPDLQKNDPGGKPYFGDSALIMAIEIERLDIVKALVSKGANVDLAGIAGFTPLIYAARVQNEPLLRYLLSKGAKPNVKNIHGDTAIIFAANMGHVAGIRALLDAKADINGGIGWTPLMQAAYNGNNEALAYLLKRRADPNFHRKPYMSPLECARAQGNEEGTKLLTKAGAKAEKKAKTSPIDRQKEYAKAEKAFRSKQAELAKKHADLSVLADEDRAILAAFLDDLAAYQGRDFELNHFDSKKLFVFDTTNGSMSEFQDGQINSELDTQKALQIDLAMRKNLIDRNHKEVKLTDIPLHNSNVLIRRKEEIPKDFSNYFRDPPAKGYVGVDLPGVSQNGAKAVVRFHFGPTPHGAAGTCYLEKVGGNWIVRWKVFAHYV